MIIVNGILKVKENKNDDVIEKAKPLIEASRKHEGNISYNLYQDTIDGSLTFVEKWESKEALQKHMQTPEFGQFSEEVKEFLAGELGIELYYGQLLSDNATVEEEKDENLIKIYFKKRDE